MKKDLQWWGPRILYGAVGLVLLTAGILKALEMEIFIRQIKDYGIISNSLLLLISAWGLVMAECTIGMSLLISFRPKITIPLATSLLGLFLWATAFAWITGTTDDCGCFGAWLERSPGEAMIEDLILIIALIPAWFMKSQPSAGFSGIKRWAFMLTCGLGLMLPLVSGPSIFQIYGFQHRVEENNEQLFELKGFDKADLDVGVYLFVLMDTDCNHCSDSIPELNFIARESANFSVIALTTNDEGKRKSFINDFNPVFPVLQIGEDDFWRLLGDEDIPKTILVRNRRIIKEWRLGVPDIDEILRSLEVKS